MTQLDDLTARLNAETGRISWSELERHFARGSVVRIDASLDLVEVAAAFSEDDKARVERWLTSGEVARASEEDARRWSEQGMEFWAVVTAPWVLVQEAPQH